MHALSSSTINLLYKERKLKLLFFKEISVSKHIWTLTNMSSPLVLQQPRHQQSINQLHKNKRFPKTSDKNHTIKPYASEPYPEPNNDLVKFYSAQILTLSLGTHKNGTSQILTHSLRTHKNGTSQIFLSQSLCNNWNNIFILTL